MLLGDKAAPSGVATDNWQSREITVVCSQIVPAVHFPVLEHRQCVRVPEVCYKNCLKSYSLKLKVWCKWWNIFLARDLKFWVYNILLKNEFLEYFQISKKHFTLPPIARTTLFLTNALVWHTAMRKIWQLNSLGFHRKTDGYGQIQLDVLPVMNPDCKAHCGG